MIILKPQGGRVQTPARIFAILYLKTDFEIHAETAWKTWP